MRFTNHRVFSWAFSLASSLFIISSLMYFSYFLFLLSWVSRRACWYHSQYVGLSSISSLEKPASDDSSSPSLSSTSISSSDSSTSLSSPWSHVPDSCVFLGCYGWNRNHRRGIGELSYHSCWCVEGLLSNDVKHAILVSLRFLCLNERKVSLVPICAVI